jgi:hypothetical protein
LDPESDLDSKLGGKWDPDPISDPQHWVLYLKKEFCCGKEEHLATVFEKQVWLIPASIET